IINSSNRGLYTRTGTVTLNDCTVSGNSGAILGGGISDGGGTLILTNTTVSGNSANQSGGGMFIEGGTATLTNCTISGNSARVDSGGIANGASLTLGNTIVAMNNAPTGPDVDGSFTSDGYNLIGKTDASSGWIASGSNKDLTGTIASPKNPLLGSLGNNG